MRAVARTMATASTSKEAAEDAKNTVSFFDPDNANDYLGNVYIAVFEESGMSSNCNEQFFQAAKAALFKDREAENSIMDEKKPKKQVCCKPTATIQCLEAGNKPCIIVHRRQNVS